MNSFNLLSDNFHMFLTFLLSKLLRFLKYFLNHYTKFRWEAY